MRITEIISMTTNKAKVLFDGGSSLVLYKGELKKLHWQEESEVDQAEYDRVRKEIVEKRAKLYAMRLLQDQDRTEKEITDKIKRAGYEPEIAQAALDYVKGFGYVDDDRYAANYIERARGSKSGRQIRKDLIKRGISSETVAAMFEEKTDEEDEYAAIVKLLKKRRFNPEAGEDLQSAQKERDKQLRYLASKGFAYGSVRHVLDHWDEYE